MCEGQADEWLPVASKAIAQQPSPPYLRQWSRLAPVATCPAPTTLHPAAGHQRPATQSRSQLAAPRCCCQHLLQ